MKYDIFISYRHTDGRTTAQLIYDRLIHKGYKVFLDIESLESGKFNHKLLSKIDNCKDMIIILSKDAFKDYTSEENWLYQELKYGLTNEKNILPIKLNEFSWPNDIPKELSELEKFSYIEDSNSYFDAVIKKIIKNLKSRPIIGGYYITLFQKEKIILKNKLKNGKFILIIITLFIAIIAFGTWYQNSQKNQNRINSEKEIFIELTPYQDVTITEYYEALEILKKRFQILANGTPYTFQTSEDIITVTLPMDIFHNYNVESILLHYVINPSETLIPDEEINKHENIINLLEFNSSETTASNIFEYSIKYPVKWEYQNEGTNFGTNQKEIDALDGSLLRIDYSSTQSDFTDGEFYDTVKIIKNRLDLFDAPYAFGYRTDDNHIISIMMDPKYLNEQIITLLVSNDVIIENAYAKFSFDWILTTLHNDILDATILTNYDGTYSIQIIPDYASFSSEDFSANLNLRFLAVGNSIHENITDSNYNEHYVQLDECVFENTFKNNSFIFDSLSCMGLDSIDTEHLYILKLIRAVILDSGLPCLYRIDSYFKETDDFEFSLENTYDEIEKLEKLKYEEILDEYKEIADYDIEVFDSGQHINLKVILHNETEFADKANSVIQLLYPKLTNKIKTAMTNGGRLTFFFTPEYNTGTGITCTFIIFPFDDHVNLWGSYNEYSTPDVVNRFEEILNTDTFYQQFSVDPIIQTEDGKTTFK